MKFLLNGMETSDGPGEKPLTDAEKNQLAPQSRLQQWSKRLSVAAGLGGVIGFFGILDANKAAKDVGGSLFFVLACLAGVLESAARHRSSAE